MSVFLQEFNIFWVLLVPELVNLSNILEVSVFPISDNHQFSVKVSCGCRVYITNIFSLWDSGTLLPSLKYKYIDINMDTFSLKCTDNASFAIGCKSNFTRSVYVRCTNSGLVPENSWHKIWEVLSIRARTFAVQDINLFCGKKIPCSGHLNMKRLKTYKTKEGNSHLLLWLIQKNSCQLVRGILAYFLYHELLTHGSETHKQTF